MDLAEFRRRLKELRLDDKKPRPEGLAEYLQALLRLEREALVALGRRRPRDGGEGDRSSLVRHPTRPKPSLRRSAVAIPLDSASDDAEV